MKLMQLIFEIGEMDEIREHLDITMNLCVVDFGITASFNKPTLMIDAS